MSDLLSGASLFLATLGLLYGAWYAEIRSAAATRVARYKQDRESDIQTVRATLWGKAVPLAASSTVIVVILLPPVATIAWDAFQYVLGSADQKLRYDPVRALFVAVFCLTLGLAIHLAFTTFRLSSKLKKLRGPDLTQNPG